MKLPLWELLWAEEGRVNCSTCLHLLLSSEHQAALQLLSPSQEEVLETPRRPQEAPGRAKEGQAGRVQVAREAPGQGSLSGPPTHTCVVCPTHLNCCD